MRYIIFTLAELLLGDQIKEHQMGGTSSASRDDEKYIPSFGPKSEGKGLKTIGQLRRLEAGWESSALKFSLLKLRE
jgi:hypothetical protein